MANPRAEIPIVVLSESNPTYPIVGATATIKKRGGAAAQVYVDAGTTNTTVAQPLSTDSTGKLSGWIERGAYEVIITISGKTPYTEEMDIATGSDGSIDTAWLADEAVTGAKVSSAIKDAAAGTASLRTLGTGATQAVSGTDSRLSDERTPKAGSVSTAKIEDGSVTTAKMAAGSGYVPTGCVLPWAGYEGSVPTGFLLCNGAVFSPTTYAALYSVIGNTYGGTTSNPLLPDLRGRVIVGADLGIGRLDNGYAPRNRGAAGGSMWLQSHAHSSGSLYTADQQFTPQQQLPNNYNLYGPQSLFNAISGWVGNTNAVYGTTAAEGNGGSQNMPPYQVLNNIIKI